VVGGLCDERLGDTGYGGTVPDIQDTRLSMTRCGFDGSDLDGPEWGGGSVDTDQDLEYGRGRHSAHLAGARCRPFAGTGFRSSGFRCR
jgi:hypothetical protein